MRKTYDAETVYMKYCVSFLNNTWEMNRHLTSAIARHNKLTPKTLKSYRQSFNVFRTTMQTKNNLAKSDREQNILRKY